MLVTFGYSPGVPRRIAAIVVILALGVAASGQAATGGGVRLVTPAGKPAAKRYRDWVAASLVPTAPGRVTLRLTGCPALPKAAGCVYSRHPRVVYLRRGVHDGQGVLLHELGHVFDLLVLSNRDRGRFRHIMGAPASRRWWSGRTPLAEWFAEGYSWCARYARIASLERYAIYHYRPTARQHREVCALIRDAGSDHTPPQPPPSPPVVSGDPTPPPPPPPAAGTVPGAPAPTPTPTPTPTPVPTVIPLPPLPIPTPRT
jgi:hypothetical protein